VLHLPIPGRAAAAFRAGRNTVEAGERGRIRWRDWLRSDPAVGPSDAGDAPHPSR
jgi:hypothetical protein